MGEGGTLTTAVAAVDARPPPGPEALSTPARVRQACVAEGCAHAVPGAAQRDACPPLVGLRMASMGVPQPKGSGPSRTRPTPTRASLSSSS